MTQHILDNYNVLTAEEKNRPQKLVLKKVTAYRTPDGELSAHIDPKYRRPYNRPSTALLIDQRGSVF